MEEVVGEASCVCLAGHWRIRFSYVRGASPSVRQTIDEARPAGKWELRNDIGFHSDETACYTVENKHVLEARSSQMRDDRSARFPLGSRVQLETLSRDPYPVLKALQEQEPVSWVPEAQAWFVTRRADCLAILLDSATFSVASPASLLEDTLGQTMLSTDGARQRQLRQPFNGPFAPREVQARMAAPITAYVHDLIDGFASAGTGRPEIGLCRQTRALDGDDRAGTAHP